MALPNKPYIGNQTPNNPFYTPDEPATFDRLAGSLVPDVQLDPNPSDPGYATWVRPGEWLTLPGIGQTQEKFVGLFAIYNTDSNFVAFSFEGDFRVDWGDGHVENYSSGDKAQHAYSWARTPANTATSRGYRQVIITVTPQPGNHLTYMDLGYYHDNVALDGYNYVATPWLDISVSMPQADSSNSVWFGVYTIALGLLEKVTIVNAGGATDFEYLMQNCYNLGEFNLLKADYLEDCYDTFFQCHNLKNVNLCDLPSVYNTDYMFQECYNLEHIEMTGLSSADYFSDMFYDCHSLKSVKMSGLTAAGSSLYYLVDSYINQRNTRSLTLEDLNSLENLEDAFYDWGWDFKGHLKLTGLTGLTNITDGLAYNYGLESVELSGLENATSAYDAFYECESLKSVKLEGTKNIEDTSYMFYGCYALETAPTFDTSSVVYMYDMFDSCYSLQNVPLYDTSNVEEMQYMFYNCYSLRTIPQFDTSSVIYFYQMFYSCHSLQTIPLLKTSTGEDMSEMFGDCQSITSIPALDVSNPDNYFGSNMFNSCTALGSAPLKGAVNDISFYNCCLSRNAILDIFKGLGTTSGADINVSYNYGAEDLTADDIAIAEDKGWTVTY